MPSAWLSLKTAMLVPPISASPEVAYVPTPLNEKSLAAGRGPTLRSFEPSGPITAIPP